MKIGFGFGSLGIGGSELNAVRTIEALVKCPECEPIALVLQDGPLLARLEATGISIIRKPLKRLWGVSAAAVGLSWARELRQRRVDILHTQDIYSNVFFAPWAAAARVPVVVTSRRWLSYSPRWGMASADRLSSWLADYTTANSEPVAAALRNEYWLPVRKIAVFPNFLGPAAFDTGSRRELCDTLRAAGVPEGATVVGAVCRLHPVKDLPTLVHAAERVCKFLPSVHIVIVGEGEERARLARLIAQLGLAQRVHMLGALPNLPNVNQVLDVAVLPSLTEGSPNALLEAMAVGVPVVATAVGGSLALIKASGAGVAVPPGDSSALCSAILELLSSSERRTALGQAGRQFAMRTHSEAKVIGDLRNWYSSLLDRLN